MRDIDPSVYRAARGTGIAAFVAFLQIALAGYAIYAIRFAFKAGGAPSLLMQQATWSTLFPVWLAIIAAFHSDRLTKAISRVVMALAVAALAAMWWIVLSTHSGQSGGFVVMNLVAAFASVLAAEIPRAWLFEGRRLHSRAGMSALVLFSLNVLLLLFYYMGLPHIYVRYALGALAVLATVASLLLRFYYKTALSPSALHAATAASSFLALIAAHQGYSAPR